MATTSEQPNATAETAAAHAAEQPAPDARELDNLAALSSDLECGGCGYQIAVYTTPPECPMCRERRWQPIAAPPATLF